MRVFGFGRRGGVEEPLLFAIGLDQRDLLLAAAAETEVVQRLLIDREDAAGCAVLRCHVGDGGAIGEGKLLQSRPEEFDELADDAVLAQHLGNGQNEVGCGCSGGEFVLQPNANDLRDQHRHRLA